MTASCRDSRKIPSRLVQSPIRAACSAVPAMELADASGGVAAVVHVQRCGSERGGERERRRGQGKAAGEDGLEDPLGHLPGPGVQVGQQQDRGQGRLVKRPHVGERDPAGEGDVRPLGGARPLARDAVPVKSSPASRNDLKAPRVLHAGRVRRRRAGSCREQAQHRPLRPAARVSAGGGRLRNLGRRRVRKTPAARPSAARPAHRAARRPTRRPPPPTRPARGRRAPPCCRSARRFGCRWSARR
jgi:hypothetical protein